MKRINLLSALFFCTVILAACAVAGKNIKDLKYPPLNAFEVPQPDKVVLDNGMIVYLLEDHMLPKVNLMLIMRRCGSYLDPPHLVGLADITGTVMRTGGTTRMTGDEIDEELESIGAYVESSIGTTNGSVSAYSLSDYLERVVNITADITRNPVFDEDKINLAKTEMRSAISRRNDEPNDIAAREFRKIIYGPDSPYARHTEYATIEAITRDDLAMFHMSTVKPNYIQLAIWGDFDRTEVLDLIDKYFGDWPRDQTETLPPPEVAYIFQPSVNYAEKEDVNQSVIYMGHIGGRMGDPDYPAAIVMNSILGNIGGSRLFDNVRTRKGLVYHTEGNYTFYYSYPGTFYAYAMTKSESTVAAIREMTKQIRSMQTDLPAEEEMRLAKDGWLNAFVFQFDTESEIIQRMLTYDYYGLPGDYIQQVKTAVENVTPQDVLEVAQRKLVPDNLHVLVIGNEEDFDGPLADLGNVNEVDITIPGPAEEEFAATDQELTQGLELFNKTVKVCGGVASFKKIKNIKSSSKVTMTMPQGSMTVDVTSIEIMPDRVMQVIRTPMGEQTMVYDGGSGWVSMPGQAKAMPAADLEERQKEAERNMPWMFAHADNPYFKVAYRGEEEFNDAGAIRLDFKTDAGAKFTLYLDPQTYMPVGQRHVGQTMMGPGEVVQAFNEFKEFGGVKMPVKVSQNAGGMDIEIEVVTIDVNADIDESVFEKPEGI